VTSGGFGALFFFETYVRDVALRGLALHHHRPLSLRRKNCEPLNDLAESNLEKVE